MSRPNSKSVIYGVTVGASANSLLRGQLAWFADRGWSVSVVANPDERAIAAVTREGVDLNGIRMEREISLLKDFRGLFSWIRLLRRERVSVVNVGTPKAGLLGGIAAWLNRVPTRVYVVRGLRLEGETGIKKWVLWVMERISTAVATDVIVVSDSLGRELLDRRLARRSKVVLIGNGSSNGVDAEHIIGTVSSTNSRTFRQQIGFPDDVIVVGFIGRLTPAKGLDVLLATINHFKNDANLRFLVIGSPEDQQGFDPFDGFPSNVYWIPTTTEIPKFLSIMDMLILPTRREGFPNVVLEAAAAGVPTLTTRATGAIDSVIDGQTGLLFDIGDYRALIQLISELRDNENLRSRMGVAAQKRVVTAFRQEIIWSGLESIYMGRPNEDVKPILQPNFGISSKE